MARSPKVVDHAVKLRYVLRAWLLLAVRAPPELRKPLQRLRALEVLTGVVRMHGECTKALRLQDALATEVFQEGPNERAQRVGIVGGVCRSTFK